MFNATNIDSVYFDIFFQFYCSNLYKMFCYQIFFIIFLLFRYINYFLYICCNKFFKIIRIYAFFNVTNAARSILYFYIKFKIILHFL